MHSDDAVELTLVLLADTVPLLIAGGGRTGSTDTERFFRAGRGILDARIHAFARLLAFCIRSASATEATRAATVSRSSAADALHLVHSVATLAGAAVVG